MFRSILALGRFIRGIEFAAGFTHSWRLSSPKRDRGEASLRIHAKGIPMCASEKLLATSRMADRELLRIESMKLPKKSKSRDTGDSIVAKFVCSGVPTQTNRCYAGNAGGVSGRYAKLILHLQRVILNLDPVLNPRYGYFPNC